MIAQQGWTKEDTVHNILAIKQLKDVLFKDFDSESIMGYDQPGHWFTDGLARYGGKKLSEGDIEFMNYLYPNKVEESDISYSDLVDALLLFSTDRNRKEMLKYRTVIPVANYLGLTPPSSTNEEDVYNAIVEKLKSL